MSMAMAYALKKRSKKMAEGGRAEHEGVNKETSRYRPGESMAGTHTRAAADPSRSHSEREYNRGKAKDTHHAVLSGMQSQRGQDRTNLAEGGDIVSKAMAKRMAKGGVVSNDDEDRDVEFEKDEFDDLEKDDHLEASDSGSDEIGDERLEDDDRDIVSRVMKSRRKGDRMPRPA